MPADDSVFAETTLTVLAGGFGRRMGLPKADLLLSGVPILQFLLRRWDWPGPTLLVTAAGRTQPPGADLFRMEQSDSSVPAYAAGPLRGAFTALSHVRTPFALVTTVDMPALTAVQLQWLAARLRAERSWLGVMLTVRRGNVSEVEPFPLACRPAALPVIAERLAKNRNSVVGLQEEPGFAVVPAPADWPVETWTNLNSPADHAAFVASLSPPAV